MGGASHPSKARKFARLGLVAIGLMVLFAAAAVLSVVLYLRSVGERSVLSPGEWGKLRARLFGAVEEAPSMEPDLVPETAELPRQRSRLAPPTPPPDVLTHQAETYAESRPKSVVDLQPWRVTSTMVVLGAGGVEGRATLVNLNPVVNRWYLLLLEWADGREGAYHLINREAGLTDLTLDTDFPSGLTFTDSLGKRLCDLWSAEAPLSLETASRSSSPYVSLCGDEIALRLKTPGRRTALEWGTDFLRDNVWGGESITVFVRQRFFQDVYLSTSEVVPEGEARFAEGEDVPASARLAERFAEAMLAPGDLGIAVEGASAERLAAGRWHRVRFHPGVFASVVQPSLLDDEILRSQPNVVSPLDDVEREALVYLVAFDLSRFDLGFAIGTEHPRVRWSERVPDSVRNSALPGPDGIDDIAPLVATGIVPPGEAASTRATFTGGFKRDHGAFRVSELATRNHGSHYGFVESGTILSKLQPGLATIFALVDGRIEMKTWTEEDDALLPSIVFARQNGLPVVETDPETGATIAGARVAQWAAGNWSGSQDRKFRTVRAGAAIQESSGRRFLIYAYFSSATPSAMARVFQAYGCRYGMLLDMNALEHTYLALYHVEESELRVQHLVRGMEVLDKTFESQVLPRFLGFADNRDFFFLTQEEEASP